DCGPVLAILISILKVDALAFRKRKDWASGGSPNIDTHVDIAYIFILRGHIHIGTLFIITADSPSLSANKIRVIALGKIEDIQLFLIFRIVHYPCKIMRRRCYHTIKQLAFHSTVLSI